MLVSLLFEGSEAAAFSVVIAVVVSQCESVALLKIGAGHVSFRLRRFHVPLYSDFVILWVMCRNLWLIATFLFDVVWLQD